MRRGSVSSWQNYGMRNSDCMMQTYAGNTAFSSPSEETVHLRQGGWFLTYRKIISFIVLIAVAVIVAGLIGWNVGTLPKIRVYDPSILIEGETEEGDEIIPSISPYVHPTKYHLELTPISDANETLKIKGRVVIEFRIDSTLTELTLSAWNITTTGCKLSRLEENNATVKRRRKRRTEIDNDNVTALDSISSGQSKTQEGKTLDDITDHRLGNLTFLFNNENPFIDKDLYAVTTNATAPDTAASGNLTEIEIQRYEVDVNNGLHVIHPAVGMNSGTYSLEIDYMIVPDGRVIYSTGVSESSEGKFLIGTHLKPIGASRLLPLFDDVHLKAVFSLSVTRPQDARVFSNMPLKHSNETSNNSMIDSFEDTPLLSPYNLAFVIAEIESLGETTVGSDKTTTIFWGDSKRRVSREIYLLKKFNQVVTCLNDVFSMPYPLPKLDIVALPPRIVSDTGSPGLISMKQSLFYTTDRSTMVTKTDALGALISLTAEQWLGGVVNMKNWTDIWLLEGFMFYLRHTLIDMIDLSLYSSHSFVADVQWDAMEEDSYSISRSLQSNINPAHLEFSDENPRNKKGACLIRMLHSAINDTAFRNGYRTFLKRWNYSTVDVGDFWETMGEEVSILPADINLSEAMNSWIFHGGYPIINVIRNYDGNSAVIRQERFMYDQPSSDTQPTWYVPLDYINKMNDDWSSPTKLWLYSTAEMVVNNISTPDSWIVFNVNKTGYYRVHYDEENWKLLAQTLEENHEVFPAETRASLIDDVLSLAAVGLTRYAIAFDFIKYMQTRERHYAPWGVLMRHLLKLNGLLYETSGFSDFQEFTLRFTSQLYSDVGWKIDEGSRLTSIAVTIACVFENAECLDWARNHFTKLKDRVDVNEILPPYAREVVYCTIARYGTRNEWNYFVERANSTGDREERNRLLSALPCFQLPWILQSLLSELVEGKMYNDDEIQRILKSFPQNPIAAQQAYKFVRNKWQDIITRFSKSRLVLKAFARAMINGLTTEEDLNDFETFSEDNSESIKIVGYTMAMVEAHADFAMIWLKDSLPEVQECLTGVNNATGIST